MITLPSCPPIQRAVPRLIGFFEDQTPVLGGPISRVARMGDRWAIDVETFPARYAEHGMAYLSRLVRGMREEVILAFPEPGLSALDYGVPVVASAGAAGQTLPVSGLTPGVTIREGKFLSIVISGRRYLHQVTADVVVAGDGLASLPIYPMLRRQPPAGSVIELAVPKISGFVQGRERDWQVSRSKYLPFSFSLIEVE